MVFSGFTVFGLLAEYFSLMVSTFWPAGFDPTDQTQSILLAMFIQSCPGLQDSVQKIN